MESEILERIGLTKGEIKVYFSLLELGPSTTGPLVDASGVSSSKIYLVLDRLIKKGLVSYSLQKRKKYFEAADPRRIVDYLGEREKELGEQKSEMSKLLPSLLKRRELTKQKHQATIFRGVKGLESAYGDILRTMKPGGEYYVLSAPQTFPDEFRRFLNKHHKRREMQRIRVKIMLSEKLRPTLGADRASNRYVELKYLPQGLILPETILIYGDKAFTIVWGKEPVVFLLESKEYADSMRLFFNLLWNEETRTYRGMAGMEAAYWGLLDGLKQGDEYHVINTSLKTPPEFGEFLRKFHAVRGEKGVRLKVIMSEALKGSVGKDRELEKNTLVKYVPSGAAGPQGIIIAKDTILTIVWGKQPVVFLLKNKENANSMKMFFDFLWNRDTRTYRGEKELMELFDDTLNYKEILFIGSGGYFYDLMPKSYVKEYFKKAVRKGLIWRHIARPDMRNHPVTNLPISRARYLEERLENPTVIWIWGNKVANVIWAKEPVAFVFENKETAENHRKYFEMLWRNSEE